VHPDPHLVDVAAGPLFLESVSSTPLPPVILSQTTILADLAHQEVISATTASYSAPSVKLNNYDSLADVPAPPPPAHKSDYFSSEVKISAEPVHPNPKYKPEKVLEPTKAKCRIEEVKVTAEICTPTVSKDCKTLRLKTKNLRNKSECLKIVKTVCNQVEEREDQEVCYYEYNMEEEDTDARTVEVDYDVKCESTTQEYCPPKQGYGQGYGQSQGYCKHANTKVCHNKPSLDSVKKRVNVAYPVPKEVCVNEPVTIPRVECEEVETETCIDLPYVQDETVELEKCGAELDKPKCKETVLTLPTQICEEVLEYEAPAYGTPAPAYGTPAPAYAAPVQSYNPSYSAPSYSG